MTIRVSIEPGDDLIGRFGDTVVLISRAGASDVSASELLGLVAELSTDRDAQATAVAARLASWVLNHLSGNIAAFGIVAPVPDGVVVFLRGAVRCSVSAGGSRRDLSGEQALTWVDQILPGQFDWLTIGGANGVGEVDPISDLQAGVVPGRGFVLSGVQAPDQPASPGTYARPADSALPADFAAAGSAHSVPRSRRHPGRARRPGRSCRSGGSCLARGRRPAGRRGRPGAPGAPDGPAASDAALAQPAPAELAEPEPEPDWAPAAPNGSDELAGPHGAAADHGTGPSEAYLQPAPYPEPESYEQPQPYEQPGLVRAAGVLRAAARGVRALRAARAARFLPVRRALLAGRPGRRSRPRPPATMRARTAAAAWSRRS